MQEKTLSKHTIAEYLDYDNQSNTRNEYENGNILALAGGSLNHGIIGNNINSEINGTLKKRTQNVYLSMAM